MRYYIDVIHKDPDSDYGISFPDFACVSAGSTFEEAMRRGREALKLQIEEMLSAGEDGPEPMDVADIMADTLLADGEPVLIGVPFEEIVAGSARRAA